MHLLYSLGKTKDLIAYNSATTALEKIFIGKNLTHSNSDRDQQKGSDISERRVKSLKIESA